MKAHIFEKDIKFGRFNIQRTLQIRQDEEFHEIKCRGCGETVNHNQFIYLCSDMNKIWHEGCINDLHIKETMKKVGSQMHHYDFFCLIKFVPKEIFDRFESKIIQLNI